jgi:hypothetical protein
VIPRTTLTSSGDSSRKVARCRPNVQTPAAIAGCWPPGGSRTHLPVRMSPPYYELGAGAPRVTASCLSVRIEVFSLLLRKCFGEGIRCATRCHHESLRFMVASWLCIECLSCLGLSSFAGLHPCVGSLFGMQCDVVCYSPPVCVHSNGRPSILMGSPCPVKHRRASSECS